MQRGRNEIYGDEDFVFESDDTSPVEAAFNCGLKGISFLGYWTAGTNLAYMRGRAARFGNPIIDFPDAPALTSRVILHA